MLGRWLFRLAKTEVLPTLAQLANASAVCNVAQPGGVNWYAWDAYFDDYFRPNKGISQLHQFTFDAAQPGAVRMQKFLDSPEQDKAILKGPVAELLSAATLSEWPTCARRSESLWLLHFKMNSVPLQRSDTFLFNCSGLPLHVTHQRCVVLCHAHS